VLTIVCFLTICPPKWRLRSLRSRVLTQTSRQTTMARITNCILGCYGVAGITKMKMTKMTSAMTSPRPGGDDSPRQNSRGSTLEPVMSTGLGARMATMRMQMRMKRKKHRKPTMDQRRMRRTEGIVGLTCELVISMGISARMPTM